MVYLLNRDQEKSLAEFSGNFALIWLAAGIVPSVLGQNMENNVWKIIPSVVIALVFLSFMLYLNKGRKK